jgi:hypothetical protein
MSWCHSTTDFRRLDVDLAGKIENVRTQELHEAFHQPWVFREIPTGLVMGAGLINAPHLVAIGRLLRLHLQPAGIMPGQRGSGRKGFDFFQKAVHFGFRKELVRYAVPLGVILFNRRMV